MNGILVLIGAALFALGFWTGQGFARTGRVKMPELVFRDPEHGFITNTEKRLISIPARWEDE